MQKIEKHLCRILSACGLVIFSICAGCQSETVPLSRPPIDNPDLQADIEREILAELAAEKGVATSSADIDLNGELEAEILAEAGEVDLNAQLEAEALSELKQENTSSKP